MRALRFRGRQFVEPLGGGSEPSLGRQERRNWLRGAESWAGGAGAGIGQGLDYCILGVQTGLKPVRAWEP